MIFFLLFRVDTAQSTYYHKNDPLDNGLKQLIMFEIKNTNHLSSTLTASGNIALCYTMNTV